MKQKDKIGITVLSFVIVLIVLTILYHAGFFYTGLASVAEFSDTDQTVLLFDKSIECVIDSDCWSEAIKGGMSEIEARDKVFCSIEKLVCMKTVPACPAPDSDPPYLIPRFLDVLEEDSLFIQLSLNELENLKGGSQ